MREAKNERSQDGIRLFQDWKVEARSVDVASELMRRGINLARTGEGYEGPCPSCGGVDRFSINLRKQVFNCRGAEGNDVIGMVMHLDGATFTQACATLTGRPAPSGTAAPLTESQPNEVARRQLEAQRQAARREADERRRRERDLQNATWIFDNALPIAGTQAAAYLARRGLAVFPSWTFDLRFVPSLLYLGFRTPDSDVPHELGAYPAMVAAIRNGAGELIGIHRTYLDPTAPNKLTPPGDPRRNKAKKIMGRVTGGMVRLSPIRPILALGEGIETSQSWLALGIGCEDVAVASAVSLGNLAGGCLGTERHPSDPKRRIPSRRPDMDRPGVILPDEVEEVVLLGDGDSDPETTCAHLAVAGRRFVAQGRKVSIHLAPRRQGLLGRALRGRGGGRVNAIQSLAEFEVAHPPPQKEFKSHFGAIHLSDLDRPGPEYEHLIKGILTRGETSMLVGPSGSGKSFLATEMSLSIARGIDFMRVQTTGQTVRPKVRRGGVIYIAGEGARGLKKRLRAYRQAHGIEQERQPFILLTLPVDLHGSDDHTSLLIEEVQHHSAAFEAEFAIPVELIVIDTLSASSPGANENASDDVSRILGRCHRLSNVTSSAVMLVHHMNASGQRERGHSSLRANVDSVIEVSRQESVRDADGRTVRLAKITKQKDGEDGISWRFVLRQIVLGRDADNDLISSCICALPVESDVPESETAFEFRGPNARLIFETLLAAFRTYGTTPLAAMQVPEGAKVVKLEHWREEFQKRAPFDEKDDEKRRNDRVRKAMERAVTDFQNWKLIGFNSPWVWLTGRPVCGFRTSSSSVEDTSPRSASTAGSIDAAALLAEFV